MLRMRFIVLLVTIATAVCQNPDLCPFSCNCFNRTVICKGVTMVPNGLPDDLDTLVFDRSSFEKFKQNALKTFKNLKTIRIINSNFTYIHPCTISNLNNLSKIEFVNVRIDGIVSNGFSHLSYIKDILLTDVTIQTLHEYAFNDMKNVDNFIMNNVYISKMKNFVFHDWSNIRLMQIKAATVWSMEPRPFQDFRSVDQLDIIGGVYPSSMCGMKDILEEESVKKFRLKQNTVYCSCDSMWIFDIKRNSKDLDVFNNTCISTGLDVTKLDQNQLCKGSETPECQNISSISKSRVPNCRTYTLDEPLIPGDTVQYPEASEDRDGASVMTVSYVCIVLTQSFMNFV